MGYTKDVDGVVRFIQGWTDAEGSTNLLTSIKGNDPGERPHE